MFLVLTLNLGYAVHIWAFDMPFWKYAGSRSVSETNFKTGIRIRKKKNFRSTTQQEISRVDDPNLDHRQDIVSCLPEFLPGMEIWISWSLQLNSGLCWELSRPLAGGYVSQMEGRLELSVNCEMLASSLLLFFLSFSAKLWRKSSPHMTWCQKVRIPHLRACPLSKDDEADSWKDINFSPLAPCYWLFPQLRV